MTPTCPVCGRVLVQVSATGWVCPQLTCGGLHLLGKGNARDEQREAKAWREKLRKAFGDGK